MKGLCFNCLARDHMVASCRSPTRCWRWRQFEHTSAKCLPRSSGQPSISYTHNSQGVPSPPHIASFTDTIVGDNLLMSRPPPSPCERLEDPMLHETLLMDQRIDIEGGTPTPSVLSVIFLPVKKSILQCCLEVTQSNWLDRS
jgi:hypothetical protein